MAANTPTRIRSIRTRLGKSSRQMAKSATRNSGQNARSSTKPNKAAACKRDHDAELGLNTDRTAIPFRAHRATSCDDLWTSFRNGYFGC